MWLLALASPVLAQIDRYELGLRLANYERHLGACGDSALVASSLGELERAVQAFFRLDLEAVAVALDAADRRLAAPAPDAATCFARSLQLVVARRLSDPAAGAVPFVLRAAFTPPTACPPDLVLTIAVAGEAAPRVQVPVRELPVAGELSLRDAPLGDHELCWSLRSGERVLAERRQGIALAADVATRLAALERASDEAPATATLESGSLALQASMLAAMTQERREETVFPGARLLADAEALLAADRQHVPFFTAARTGEHWLRVPLARSAATVRMLAPAVPAGEKRPIVLALHGAGGSENMFFDSYSAGAIVAACRQRGWFLVAPRSELLGNTDLPALVDALAARWPIDAARVLLVGHSMGAAQATAAAVRTPERFAAVALLGGGGGVGKGKGLAGRPFFVGAGERDFGRSGAMALHRALAKANADATWKLYPGVEHLSVVQFALPDVFAFFEAALLAKAAAAK